MLFQKNGYDRTSVREISEAVGIQKASIYYHFNSKEDILAAIHNQVIDILFDCASLRQESDAQPDELLCGYIEDILHTMQEFRPHMEVFTRERYALVGELCDLTRSRRQRYESLLHDVITSGIEAGVVRPDVDSKIAAAGIFGMCLSCYEWFDLSEDESLEEITSQFTSMVLGGLCPRVGGGKSSAAKPAPPAS